MSRPRLRGRLLPATAGLAALLVGGGGVAVAALTGHPGGGRNVTLGGHGSGPALAAPLDLPSGLATGPAATPAARPTATTTAAVPSSRPTAAAATASVAPLTARVVPDVLVTAPRSFTSPEAQKILVAAHITAGIAVDAARVHLGRGTTLALGVDPSTFRAYTPQGTAESTPLWRSVAAGNVAVAQTVAKALAVSLGGHTTLGATTPATARVGALATTALPGVGVLVDHAAAAHYGLVRNGGLVLTAAGQDPTVTAALIKAADPAVTVAPVASVEGATGTGWVAPAFGPITSPFGPRNNPNDPGHPEFHMGIDIGAGFGAPIYAAHAGYVQYAGPASGYGNEVILDHPDGIVTVYGHMEKILVTSGPVRAGQPIALVGATGDATGPHLHFEVHVDDQLVDPLAFLRAHGVRVD